MSFSKPSKYFASEKEYREWTKLVLQSADGVINGKKLGKGGVIPPCRGISFAQMKKLYDSFDNIDLTKCISWSYKLLWEAAERASKAKSYKGAATKAAVVAEFNSREEWENMVHCDPQTAVDGLDDVLFELFHDVSAPGMGFVQEGRGGESSDYKEAPLFGSIPGSEYPKDLSEHVKKTGIITDTLWGKSPYHKKVTQYLEERVGSGWSLNAGIGAADKFPGQRWVFCPIKRFPTDSFENMKSQDKPKTPGWLDKWCLKYIEKNAYVWWSDSPIRGAQHGWLGNMPGQAGNAYRRQAKGQLKEWRSETNPPRKTKDPIIQQILGYKRAWSTLDNFAGNNTPGTQANGTGVKETFVSTSNPYPTHFCVYNPYTTNGGTCYGSKATWEMVNINAGIQPQFKTWSPAAFDENPDGAPANLGEVLDWEGTEDTKPGFPSLLALARHAINNDDASHLFYPGGYALNGYQKYDLPTALQYIRLGAHTSPEAGLMQSDLTEKMRIQNKVLLDKLFADELGMGRNPKQFGNQKGQLPLETSKRNLRNKSKPGQRNMRMNLLDPVYKIEISKPWMSWSLRMVTYIIDCTNKGVFKNLPKDYKPFEASATDGQNYLKFVINLIWSVFEEFATLAKVISNTQASNDEVSEKSPFLVKQKNVGKQIQKNMQCFMLNLVDYFAQYHEAEKGTFSWINKYEFMRITGDNSNIFNLIGYKPDTINRMLNLTPAQLALMQPRIKLYKERKLFKPNKGKTPTPATQIVEVEGPFSTHTNTENLQKMLQSGTGRSMGGGIKEISIKQEGGDADFDVPSLVEVEITFLFNTMQEIFLNFPSFDPATGKVSFPYGVDPKYAYLAEPGNSKKLNKLPASYAELIFPINSKSSDYLSVLSETQESTNVVLEVGWTPPEDLKNLEKAQAVVFEDLNKQNMFRSYLLNPYDSEFNFTNEGQVELTARYHGIIRGLRSSPQNKLFPAAGIRGEPLSDPKGAKPLKNDKKLKAQVDEINKLEAKRSSGKILSGKESTKLLTLKDDVRARVLFSKSAQYDDFVERQLQGFIDQLFGTDESVYTLEVPKAFLGARTTDSNILKWQPTRDIDLMRRFPRSISRGSGAGGTSQSKLSTAVSEGQKQNNKNQDKLQQKAKDLGEDTAAGLKGETPEEKKKRLEARKKKREDAAKVSKKSSLIKKKAKEALAKSAIGFDTSKDMWPITFFYFGDFVQSVLTESYHDFDFFADTLGVDNTLDPTEKLNYILGTVLVPIIKGKVQIAHSINLADLPVTVFHLSSYIVDTLITPGAYKMTRVNFIWGFLKSIIKEYFNADCFVGQYDITSTKPQLAIFNMPSFSKKDPGNGSGGIWYLSSGGGKKNKSADKGDKIKWTKEKFKARMMGFEKESATNKQNINKRVQYKYVFLGSRSMTDGSYNRAKDLQANVHHFYFGAGAGLLKTLSFKSEELEGMTESLLLEGISAVQPQATAFIPRLFNCSVTMIGNTLFDPGQTFYVDPTMGTMLGQPGSKNKKSSGINVIRDTGLGGYFYIASIESRIAPGVFETTIEGLKTGISKKGDRRKTFTSASPDEIPTTKTPTAADIAAAQQETIDANAKEAEKRQKLKDKAAAAAAIAKGAAGNAFGGKAATGLLPPVTTGIKGLIGGK